MASINPFSYITIVLFYLFKSGEFTEDMIPTVGFNMRKVSKGGVLIKVNSLNFSFNCYRRVFDSRKIRGLGLLIPGRLEDTSPKDQR